jgi:diacylglycerol kinase family enzyme
VNIDLFAHIIKAFFHPQFTNNVEVVQHWQGKDIKITSTPQQEVQCDGEILGKMPISANVIHGAFKVMVPKEIISKD